MKVLLALSLILLTASCASPTMKMTDAQIASLSDDQACSYYNGYKPEPRLNAEIERRNLICDRHYRECLKRGNTPGTRAFAFCMDLVRENERLRAEQDWNDRFFFYGYDDYDRIRSVHHH